MNKIPWYKREINHSRLHRRDCHMTETSRSCFWSDRPWALDTLVEQSSGRMKSVLSKVNRQVRAERCWEMRCSVREERLAPCSFHRSKLGRILVRSRRI